MFPLIGALAGAGASIGSALLGADAQDEAMQYNWAINEANRRQKNRDNDRAYAEAQKIRGEQQLGGTDAQGNRTQFVKGEGWKTTLSPQQQQLVDYFYRNELPARQKQFQESASRSGKANDQADQLLNEFKRVMRENPRDIENILYEASTRGQDDALNTVTETAARQGLRSGTSNLGGILAKLASQGIEQRGNARQDAKLKALDYTDNKYATQRGGLAQLYQMFAGIAGKDLGASIDPSSVTNGGNALMQAFMSNAQQGNSFVNAAANRPSGMYSEIEPNLSTANAVGAIGSSLSGLGERIGGLQQNNQADDLLRQYMTMGGQIGEGGGLYEKIAARNRAGGGLF